MSFHGQYNTKSAGVKRLMKEASELREPSELFTAQPLEDNLFEWHFSVRGPADSDFDGGVYHGRILFPPEYPMKPPNLIILTPNGRFELGKKICLSISGYHPETWLPSWSIRTALLALVGFMPTDGAGAIGSLEYPAAERKRLAKKSLEWKCKECGACMRSALKPLSEGGEEAQKEARELAGKLQFKDEATLKAELAAVSSPQPSEHAKEESDEEKVVFGEDQAAEVSGVAPEAVQEEPSTLPGPSESIPPNPPTSSPPNLVAPSVSLPAATRRSTSTVASSTWSFFVLVPGLVLCAAIFIVLLARRVGTVV